MIHATAGRQGAGLAEPPPAPHLVRGTSNHDDRAAAVRKLFFSSFHLGVPEGWTPPMDDVVDFIGGSILADHAGYRHARGFPDRLRQPGRHPIGDRQALEVLSGDHGDARTVGLRLDTNGSERLERLELVLAERPAEGTLRIAIATYIGHTGSRVRALGTRPRPPALVAALVRRFGAYDDVVIDGEPREVAPGDVASFAAFLTGAERRLPVVACSPRNRTEKPVVSPKRLARSLVGIAHVYSLTNRFATLRLRDALGPALPCYDGAVRVYWPGAVTEARARVNRFWTAEALGRAGDRAGELLLRFLLPAATARVPEPALDWRTLEATARQPDRSGGDDAVEHDARIERLETRTAALEAALEQERRHTARWRAFYHELLDDAERLGLDADLAPHRRPETVSAAVDWAVRRYDDRLTLALNSQSELEGNPFEDADAVRRALMCLAETYIDARRGTAPCPDLHGAFLAHSGFHYAPHQSPTTMGRFRNHYTTRWRGRTVSLEEHLKKGTGRDPRRMIRIAFHYDPDSGRVVLGYIGPHQRNAAT